MQTNEKSLSAEEKIKQLTELEKAKRKELEDKKKALEEQKKELEKLEVQRTIESAEAQKEIEEKIEELAVEEQERFQELEEIRRKREAESASLEQSIEEEEAKGRIRESPRQRGYGEVIEEILQGNPTVYDITNYNVMNRLERLAQDVGTRSLTPSERSFVEIVQYHAQRLQENKFYREKDTNDYMRRELEKIDQINKMVREREKPRPGDYIP